MVNVPRGAGIGSLDDINSLIEGGLNTVTLAFAAYQLLSQLWKKKNPEGTFEQFHAYLLTEAKGMGDFSRNWFAQMGGYVQQPDGTFKKQDAEPTEPVDPNL
jgi:hypothetical protein